MVPLTVPGVIDAYIPARLTRPRDPGGTKPKWGVVHTPEGPETPTFAEDLGRYFARLRSPAEDPKNGRWASTHFGTDNNTTVRYATDDRAAFGATRVSNNLGIHVEIAGRAAQTRAQWLDEFSTAAMRRAANLFALYADHYGWELRWLTDAELRAGAGTGLTTHVDINRATGVTGGHWDPGPGFPKDVFLGMCQDAQRTEVPVTDQQIDGLLAELDRSGGRIGAGLPNPPAVVGAVQRALDRMGYPFVAVDGRWSDSTDAAVREWETRSAVQYKGDWTADGVLTRFGVEMILRGEPVPGPRIRIVVS